MLEKVIQCLDFLGSMGICDGISLFQYDLWTREQSVQWISTHSQWRKKARMSKSKIKTMFTDFLNNERTAADECIPPDHISYGIKCQDDLLNHEFWRCGSKWLRPVFWWYPSTYLDGNTSQCSCYRAKIWIWNISSTPQSLTTRPRYLTNDRQS
jgi:hypothetical protein